MTQTGRTRVPYNGSIGAMNELLCGQIGAMVEKLPNALPHIHAGALRVLTVTSERRVT